MNEISEIDFIAITFSRSILASLSESCTHSVAVADSKKNFKIWYHNLARQTIEFFIPD